MSPLRKSIGRRAQVCRQALARQLDQRGRQVDRHHVGAAARRPRRPARRCRSRHRAGAAVQVGGSQDSSVARMRSRPARTVARMRPTGASEVRRAQACAAVRSK
jgi:hypothetical protein